MDFFYICILFGVGEGKYQGHGLAGKVGISRVGGGAPLITCLMESRGMEGVGRAERHQISEAGKGEWRKEGRKDGEQEGI